MQDIPDDSGTIAPIGSHPVPAIPEVRERVTRVRRLMESVRATGEPLPEAHLPSLSSDRINYLVGEAPSYEVNNAPPDEPISWLIIRDGQLPVSFSDPTQKTDAAGRWTGSGNTWTAEMTGFYTIEAQVGLWSARTSFSVINEFSRGTEKMPTDLLGISHVAGTYRFAGPGTPFGECPFVVEGAQQILTVGARRGFFYLTPQFKSADYAYDDFGPDPIRTLTDLAKSQPYRKLFEQPFEQFVLTTYTFGNWQWILDRAQGGRTVPFLADVEIAEIADLAGYLATAYPGKKFVLKNWEGDWQLQENFDIDGVPSQERIAEFIEWMGARQEGVSKGREKAPGAESIQHAIEFNLLSHAVRDMPCVLHDVVRQVQSDLVSYSAWETSNYFDSRRTKDAIAFIEHAPGMNGRSVLIGEFGVPNSLPDSDARAHSDVLVRAFVEMGVYAFFWEIFDAGAPVGLIGPDFRHFETWFALRQALGRKNDATIMWELPLTSVPAMMSPGQTVSARLTFRNTGDHWYQSVGYEVDLLGPGEAVVANLDWLHEDVANGGQGTFTFDVTAPAELGAYILRLAQHGVEFFGEAVSFEVSGELQPVPQTPSAQG